MGWSRQGVSGVPFFVIHTASGGDQPVAFSARSRRGDRRVLRGAC